MINEYVVLDLEMAGLSAKTVFCTKLRMFISAVPVVFLLILAIKYTGKVDNLFGLWPLIIVLCAFLIFIFIFLIRFISISNEEIRMLCVFSSKDSHEISEGKTLKFTLKKKHRINIELIGKDKKPDFDWIDKSDNSQIEITMFREKAIGGERSIKRVLKYFGIPKDETSIFFNSQPAEKEYENVCVSSYIEDKERIVSIRILTTL